MQNVRLKVAVVAAMKREDFAKGTPRYRVPAYDVYQLRIVRMDSGNEIDLMEDTKTSEDARIILPSAKSGQAPLRIAEAVHGTLSHFNGKIQLAVDTEQFQELGFRVESELLHHYVTHFGIALDHPLFGMPTREYDDDAMHQHDILAYNSSNILTAADGRGLPVVVYMEQESEDQKDVVVAADAVFENARLDSEAIRAVVREAVVRK